MSGVIGLVCAYTGRTAMAKSSAAAAERQNTFMDPQSNLRNVIGNWRNTNGIPLFFVGEYINSHSINSSMHHASPRPADNPRISLCGGNGACPAPQSAHETHCSARLVPRAARLQTLLRPVLGSPRFSLFP